MSELNIVLGLIAAVCVFFVFIVPPLLWLVDWWWNFWLERK